MSQNHNQSDDGDIPIAEDNLREAYSRNELWPLVEMIQAKIEHASNAGELAANLSLSVQDAAILRDALVFVESEIVVDQIEAEVIAQANADNPAEQESAADASAATLAAIAAADADGTLRALVGQVARARAVLTADPGCQHVPLRLTSPLADLIGQLILAASDQLGGLDALASDSGACMPELN